MVLVSRRMVLEINAVLDDLHMVHLHLQLKQSNELGAGCASHLLPSVASTCIPGTPAL